MQLDWGGSLPKDEKYMIEKVFIFILFLGPLIFFHELGHFFFARLFNVRVEVFSIGFGPKMFKFKMGETEYALSLIPLGGYVKMFGDDPLNMDQIPATERNHSFTHKGKWARFWIVIGGPLANFLMAFFIFFALLLSGERVPEIKIGSLPQDSLSYKAGLRPGDRILKLNDREVIYLTDLVPKSGGRVNSIVVQRGGEKVVLKSDIDGHDFFQDFTKHPPVLKRPILVNLKGEYFWPSLRGLINENESLEDLIRNYSPHQKYFLHKIATTASLDDLNLTFTGEVQRVELSQESDFYVGLLEAGYKLAELSVKSVSMKSPADMAGIRAQDVIISINGVAIHQFEMLKEKLQENEKESVVVGLWKNNQQVELELKPELKVIEGKELRILGVISNLSYHQANYLKTKSKGFFGSIIGGFERTIDATVKTFDGFISLITQKVSFKSVGGPIAISKVASDSFNMSLSYFFQLMAFFSINLGIINLLPIPVLDGGHVMFIGLELVNGGPLSRRKMEIAQQVGLSLLLMLILGSLFNDFSRFF